MMSASYMRNLSAIVCQAGNFVELLKMNYEFNFYLLNIVYFSSCLTPNIGHKANKQW